MSAQPPIYDLVLLLDTSTEDDTRAKIVADATTAINADGEIVGTHAWGTRPLAYEIDKKTEAVYHLLQFHAHSRDVLAHLQRTLAITDGVLRFRLVKLDPGTPAPPDLSKPAAAFADGGDDRLDRGERGDRDRDR